MKRLVFVFAAIVLTFILSATLLGSYHSALSVVVGFLAGYVYGEYGEEQLEKIW